MNNIVEQGCVVNAVIGERNVVIARDPINESVGAFYSSSDAPVTSIDFFGNSDQGVLRRVETLKAGLFWHVWAEFYPNTDIDRMVQSAAGAIA